MGVRGYVRRQARNVPDIYGVRAHKERITNPPTEQPRPRLVPFDIPRIFGGTRKSKDSPPLPCHLQTQLSPTARRAKLKTKRKLRELERKINPEPKFTVFGGLKVYC